MREQTLIRLALVHTEVSEATQIVKRHTMSEERVDEFGRELADIIIRVAEIAEHYGVFLDAVVNAKLAYNRQRPYKFGTPDEVPHG